MSTHHPHPETSACDRPDCLGWEAYERIKAIGDFAYEGDGNCDEACGNPAVTTRGDLLVCQTCAAKWPANVSAYGAGWVRCSCGYDRLRTDACGEPCL